MPWDEIAPMIVAVVLILTVGGVAILRPIAKRISSLLELYATERQSGLQNDVGQIRDLLETMNARLQLIEDRQDFTERLLEGEKARRDPGRAALPAGDPARPGTPSPGGGV